MARKRQRTPKFIPCRLMELPETDWVPAAVEAVKINPANAPREAGLGQEPIFQPSRLAVLTSKYWGAAGVRLTVGWMDNPAADLRAKILSHMNAWGRAANVKFVESTTSPQVRIARARGQGYYSYLGTDVLRIQANQPTMNLEGFTMSTPDREFVRVVRHETGHTLGFPHEHLRRELVARLDPAKTIQFFRQTQGWSEQQTRANVLTPLEDREITATPEADQTSIMAYQLPGSITTDGRPIVGGSDINSTDAEFVAKLYPPIDAPPPPPPPPPGGRTRITIEVDAKVTGATVVSVV